MDRCRDIHEVDPRKWISNGHHEVFSTDFVQVRQSNLPLLTQKRYLDQATFCVPFAEYADYPTGFGWEQYLFCGA